jgi:hypothetical protein
MLMGVWVENDRMTGQKVHKTQTLAERIARTKKLRLSENARCQAWIPISYDNQRFHLFALSISIKQMDPFFSQSIKTSGR